MFKHLLCGNSFSPEQKEIEKKEKGIENSEIPRVAEQCDVNIQSINHFIIAKFYELQTKEKQTKLCNSQGKQ
ncbi:uncharacterized protein TNCV_3082231 [Trichonephila clavipes]|nr:uncharacterized protein TNCV_3082231 [Trichonephila clavipes]